MVFLYPQIQVEPYYPNLQTNLISTLVIAVDYIKKTSAGSETYNTDEMAVAFMEQFTTHVFTKNQPTVFKFQNKKVLSVITKEIEGG